MRYICLVYGDEKQCDEMSKPEFEAYTQEYFVLAEDLKKSGHLLAGDPLQPIKTTATVRVRGGKTSVADGPFIETKETLGGYFTIEARDLNEAIQIAARIPGARYGAVEVRPVWDMQQT